MKHTPRICREIESFGSYFFRTTKELLKYFQNLFAKYCEKSSIDTTKKFSLGTNEKVEYLNTDNFRMRTIIFKNPKNDELYVWLSFL